MAITYSLAPEPIWYLVNLDGTAAGGAYLYTYESLNKIIPKAVFQDPAGLYAWTNPIIFNLNGTQGPFYWQFDSDNPNSTYYLEAWTGDKNDPNSGAILLWTLDQFTPGAGGGGGGDVTTYIPIKNYITNNQFINHIPPTANPIGSTNLVIAPSNHKGFTPALVNPIVSTYGVVGPDIRFIKNNTNATDQITFPLFTLGTNPLIGSVTDVCPAEYVRYQCTNTPAGEQYKDFQFPICQKIQTLTNQAMTFTLWAAYGSVPGTINIYCRQYYGSGTATTPESNSTRVLIGSCVLTTTWTLFNIPFTVANASGNSIGTPGLQTDDDATYIEIEMPLGAPCDVLFTKPSLYLGTINPNLNFDSYDEIDSINSTARTGDVRVSLTSAAPQGWLPMNDGTIGNTGSGATLATGSFTFQLYKTIWDGVSNAWAPVSTGRGATAQADFLAGKTLKLPLSLGRALAGAGAGAGLTSRALGENTGAETVTLTGSMLPLGTPFNAFTGSGNSVVPTGGITNVPSSLGAFTQGAGLPTPIMQPTSFMNVFIKL